MKKLLLSLLAIVCSVSMMAAETTYSSRTYSSDGKTSTWGFTSFTDLSSSKTLSNAADTYACDQGIFYDGVKNSFHVNSNYLSSTNTSAVVFIPVPSGSAGTITMVGTSSYNDRYYQLYIGDVASTDDTQKLGCSTSSTSFTFDSDDLTTYESNTYLKLKAMGGEVKVNSFSVTLTTGVYMTASDLTVSSETASVKKGNSTSVTYTTSSNGVMSTSSSDETIATASVDATTKTVTINGIGAGTATITLSQTTAGSYAPGNKTITVTVTDPTAPTNIIEYNHASAVTEGITISGTTAMKSVKIHTNTDAVNCIQLANSYTTDNALNDNYIKLSYDGGFKKGDVISLAGFYNKDSEAESKVTVFVMDDSEAGYDKLWTSEQFINGRLVNDDPVVQTYTLTADADFLCIGRTGNTGTNIYSLTVSRPATVTSGTLNDKGYATFSSDKNVLISGVQAYTAELSGTTITCHKIESNIVPAYTGVLLYSETASAPYTALYQESASALSLANSLKATTTSNGTAATESSLVLNGSTFVLFDTTASFVANKAYFPYTVSPESGAKTFTIVFDDAETTAINAVETVKANNNAVYNLAGQRVNANAKGIVIINGKKFINK